MEMNDAIMIARLASVSDKEFASLFYAAVANRNGVGGETGRRFVLAETSQCGDEKLEMVFVAVEDAKHYPNEWANDAPICQAGQCANCRASIMSVAKHAICPICLSEVYCT